MRWKELMYTYITTYKSWSLIVYLCCLLFMKLNIPEGLENSDIKEKLSPMTGQPRLPGMTSISFGKAFARRKATARSTRTNPTTTAIVSSIFPLDLNSQGMDCSWQSFPIRSLIYGRNIYLEGIKEIILVFCWLHRKHSVKQKWRFCAKDSRNFGTLFVLVVILGRLHLVFNICILLFNHVYHGALVIGTLMTLWPFLNIYNNILNIMAITAHLQQKAVGKK